MLVPRGVRYRGVPLYMNMKCIQPTATGVFTRYWIVSQLLVSGKINFPLDKSWHIYMWMGEKQNHWILHECATVSYKLQVIPMQLSLSVVLNLMKLYVTWKWSLYMKS